MKRTVRVVVVDDNDAVIKSVKEYFKNSEMVNVVAGFTNGKDALNYLTSYPERYDLLMLDLILTGIDGIKIIEELNHKKINKKIMVLSSFKDDFTIRRVQALGGSYFMLKPVDMDVVNSRIVDLISHKEELNIISSNKIEARVSSLLHDLGIPSHIRGYEYIRDSVILIYAEKGMKAHLTKEVYPKIANKYQTTTTRVERAIRNAIEISWTRGDIKLMENLFGNSIDFDRSRPTNAEFLTTIADKFRLDENELVM